MRLNWRQIALIVVGTGLLALALAAGPMGWVGFERFGVNHILLIAFGITLTGLGALNERAPMRQIAAVYRNIALLLLTAVVVFLSLELVSIIATNMKNTLFFQGRIILDNIDVRRDLAYYRSVEWGAKYWEEHHTGHRVRYYPYVLWRDAEFKGETINVDADGLRLTPGAECGAGSYRLFVFGGSTVWGDGSPDWYTIPAFLQAALSAAIQTPVCVVNYGEQAFVSTQNLIQLMMELQRENIPDAVIFYDGINDVESAYQSGQAGVHQNLAQFMAQLEPNTLESALQQQLRSSYTFRLFSGLLAGQQRVKPLTYELRGIDPDALAEQTAQVYLSNLTMVKGLAAQYGFEYAFFWQPTLVVNTKPLTSQEEAIHVSIDPALVTLYREVYQRIKAAASPEKRLYYIADALDKSSESLWIDYYHITPVGNQIIAETMLDILNRSS